MSGLPDPIASDAWIGRRKAAVRELPPAEAAPGLAVLDGQPYARDGSAELLDALDASGRRAVFGAILPGLGDHVERMWQRGFGLPYQLGPSAQAFRAPSDPAATRESRRCLLAGMVRLLRGLEPPDAVTVARWAPELGANNLAPVLGVFLSAVIDGGGADGDAVFDVVVGSTAGGMGRHVPVALLTAAREDGWERVEQLLLGAQREEGLRQAILEAVDLAHPGAFARMLDVVAEHDLLRFSSAIRAVGVWLGVEVDVRRRAVAESLLRRLGPFLADEAERRRAVDEGDGADAYAALWAGAFADVHAAVPEAARLLADDDPERRYAAVNLLTRARLPVSLAALRPALADSDLRVAWRAFEALRFPAPDEPVLASDELTALAARLPGRVRVAEIPWRGEPAELDRQAVLSALIEHTRPHDADALLPHLGAMGVSNRRRFVRRIAERGDLGATGLANRRRAGERFPEGGGLSAELRAAVLRLVADPSASVREAAVATAAETIALTEEEARALEGLLTRRPGDLRDGVIGLLVGRKAPAALASADRLLARGSELERLGGIEILRRLVEGGEHAAEASTRASAYRTARGTLTRAEATQLEAIFAMATASDVDGGSAPAPVPERGLGLVEEAARTMTPPAAERGLGLVEEAARTMTPLAAERGLGLIEEGARTPPLVPEDRGVALASDAARAAVEMLDACVHEHREVEVDVGHAPARDRRLLGEIRRLRPGSEVPLLETWRGAWRERPASCRDADGLELVRACLMVQPAEDDAARALFGAVERPALRYAGIVEPALLALLRLDPPAGAAAFAVAAAETLLARGRAALADREPDAIVQRLHVDGWLAALALARRLRAAAASPATPPAVQDRGAAAASPATPPAAHLRAAASPATLPAGQTQEPGRTAALPDALSGGDAERLWRLERWVEQPHPDAERERAPLGCAVTAFATGGATEADVLDQLVGARHRVGPRWFRELAMLSIRAPRFTDVPPRVFELVDRCRQRIVDLEVARGEAPTAATQPARALVHSGGLDVLVRALTALGDDGLERGGRADGASRAAVLSHLVHASYPDATPATFAARVGEAAIPPQRLLELAAYAPQWSAHVEHALGWPGLASGVWWLHAHTKDQAWRVAPELREAWAAEVAARTPLVADELLDGAVDVGWFEHVHATLGRERWHRLLGVAKFCSSSAGHKRAELFAQALTGAVTEKELKQRIAAKRHQDAVRAVGLLPLPAGKPRDAAILRRYRLVQAFRTGSRRFGSQRQASERRAAEIALANLARTAGYRDPLRLEWAMEARGVADLAEGGQAVAVGDVEVTLELGPDGGPQLTARRSGKPLKSVPATVGRRAAVRALRDRAGDLRRQRRRVRDSLEAAMVLGDELTGDELRELAGHPLLGPQLAGLVLVAGDRLGRPDADRRALVGPDGERSAIAARDTLRIAHPLDLAAGDTWARWQRHLIEHRVAQPFKQVFRELYVLTAAERAETDGSSRYAGHQVQDRRALALLRSRGWVTGPAADVQRTFHAARVAAALTFPFAYGTPAEVEDVALESVVFRSLDGAALALEEVPPRIFSEVMRDLDLVVSVAHASGVDPEASASTVAMRAALVEETTTLLGLDGVRTEGSRVLIAGERAQWSIHLGSGVVHRLPGGAVCIVPVHGQHRGRIFLPFADDDPRTAEVLAKVLLLARDGEIRDPSILEQLAA